MSGKEELGELETAVVKIYSGLEETDKNLETGLENPVEVLKRLDRDIGKHIREIKGMNDLPPDLRNEVVTELSNIQGAVRDGIKGEFKEKKLPQMIKNFESDMKKELDKIRQAKRSLVQVKRQVPGPVRASQILTQQVYSDQDKKFFQGILRNLQESLRDIERNKKESEKQKKIYKYGGKAIEKVREMFKVGNFGELQNTNPIKDLLVSIERKHNGLSAKIRGEEKKTEDIEAKIKALADEARDIMGSGIINIDRLKKFRNAYEDLLKQVDAARKETAGLAQQEAQMREDAKKAHEEVKKYEKLIGSKHVTLEELAFVIKSIGEEKVAQVKEVIVGKTLIFGLGKYEITDYDERGIYLFDKDLRDQVSLDERHGDPSQKFPIPLNRLHDVLMKHEDLHKDKRQVKEYDKVMKHLKAKRAVKLEPEDALRLYHFMKLQEKPESEINALLANKLVIVFKWKKHEFKLLAVRFYVRGYQNNDSDTVELMDLSTHHMLPHAIPLNSHFMPGLQWSVEHVIIDHYEQELNKKLAHHPMHGANSISALIKQFGSVENTINSIESWIKQDNAWNNKDLALFRRVLEAKAHKK